MKKPESKIFASVHMPTTASEAGAIGLSSVDHAKVAAFLSELIENLSIAPAIMSFALLSSGGVELVVDTTTTPAPPVDVPGAENLQVPKEAQDQSSLIASSVSQEQKINGDHEFSLEISFFGITVKFTDVELSEDVIKIIGFSIFISIVPRIYQELIKVYRHAMNEKAYKEAEKVINVMVEDLLKMIEMSKNKELIVLVSSKEDGVAAKNLVQEKARQIKKTIDAFNQKYGGVANPALILKMENLYSAIDQGQTAPLGQALHSLRTTAAELKLESAMRITDRMIKETEQVKISRR